MPADGAFDSAAHCVAPVEIFLGSVDKIVSKVRVPADFVVNDSRLIIHADGAASGINEPAIQRDSDAPSKGRIKIATGFAVRVPKKTRLQAGSIEVHVAEIDLRSENQPPPLPVVTELPATDKAGLTVTPRLVGGNSENINVVIVIQIFAVTELTASVQTNIKSLPHARWWRSRRDAFRFLVITNRPGVRCERHQ